MRARLWLPIFALISAVPLAFAQQAVKPPPELVAKPADIAPGQVITAPEMAAFWGELLWIDPPTRTGAARDERTNQVRLFKVLPYADLERAAYRGAGLDEFLPGDRLQLGFPEEQPEPRVYLSLLRDELQYLWERNLWYRVEEVDAEQQRITARLFAADENLIHPRMYVWKVDAETAVLLNGARRPLIELKPGMLCLVASSGTGKPGEWRARAVADAFSVEQLRQQRQLAVRRRVTQVGIPGYLDDASNGVAQVTLFRGYRDAYRSFAMGDRFRLYKTNTALAPEGEGVRCTLRELRQEAAGAKASLATEGDALASFATKRPILLRPEPPETASP